MNYWLQKRPIMIYDLPALGSNDFHLFEYNNILPRNARGIKISLGRRQDPIIVRQTTKKEFELEVICETFTTVAGVSKMRFTTTISLGATVIPEVVYSRQQNYCIVINYF